MAEHFVYDEKVEYVGDNFSNGPTFASICICEFSIKVTLYVTDSQGRVILFNSDL